MQLRKILAVSAAALAVLGMSGCSGSNADKASATPSDSASPAATSSAPASNVSIYASTDVWASVAQQVAGKNVPVTASITDPGQDPHDYQASAKDKKLINDATIAIVNGGGYDDWAKQMIESAPSHPKLIDAVEISGLQPAEGEDDDKDGDHKEGDHDHEEGEGHHHHHGEFNEHVFYSLPTVQKVAEQVEVDLAAADPAHKADYEKNLENFTAKLKKVEDKAAERAKKGHVHAIATEPVVGYLLQSMDIHDITPEEFVEQSETESGPSVKVLDETLGLVKDKKIQLLILNGQTEDPVSEKLVAAAKTANIPVVQVFETFPAGTSDYVDWVNQAVDNITKALG